MTYMFKPIWVPIYCEDDPHFKSEGHKQWRVTKKAIAEHENQKRAISRCKKHTHAKAPAKPDYQIIIRRSDAKEVGTVNFDGTVGLYPAEDFSQFGAIKAELLGNKHQRKIHEIEQHTKEFAMTGEMLQVRGAAVPEGQGLT